MTNDKVDEVLRTYAARLLKLGHEAERWPADLALPHGGVGQACALRHALWMCTETLAMPESRLEKKMRWLGFIQGVLWMAGKSTIAKAKRDNMPPETVYDGGVALGAGSNDIGELLEGEYK